MKSFKSFGKIIFYQVIAILVGWNEAKQKNNVKCRFKKGKTEYICVKTSSKYHLFLFKVILIMYAQQVFNSYFFTLWSNIKIV